MSLSATAKGITEPLDMIRHCIDEPIYVKMKGERELRGKLHVPLPCCLPLHSLTPPLSQAFDQHMNLVLGNVEEVRTVLPEGEEASIIDGIGTPEQTTRNMDMLFVRGDSIILASPLN